MRGTVDRRAFLAALAASCGAPWLSACADRPELAAPARPVTTASYRTAIELDSRVVGWANAFGGSQIAMQGIADYVPGHAPPPPNAPRLFRDLLIEAGAGMSPAFYSWAATGLGGPDRARSGQIISVDASGHEIARRSFTGRVDRLEFPAPSSNCSPAILRVQIAVQDAHAENPKPEPLHPPSAPAPDWRRCDFRFEIAGLEQASRAITAVSPFTARRTSRILGTGAIAMQLPTFSPLNITLPASAAAPFARWAESGSSMEGRLAFLSPRRVPIIVLRLAFYPDSAPLRWVHGQAIITLRVTGAAIAAR